MSRAISNMTATSLAGSQYRFVPVGRVRVVVGPRTAVPMPANQYACFCIGVIRCDDVTGFQDRTVVCLHVCILVGDGRTETFEFLGNVRTAKTVGFRIRYARPERTLCSRIGESTVCIEFRILGLSLFCFYAKKPYRRIEKRRGQCSIASLKSFFS